MSLEVTRHRPCPHPHHINKTKWKILHEEAFYLKIKDSIISNTDRFTG